MRTLLILRHAKSSWSDNSLSDHERPLNKRGRSAAGDMGQFMRENQLLPELVLVSSAARAQETLERWQARAGYRGPTQTLQDLYLAAPDVYLQKLRELQLTTAKSVMCIGHNPGLEELVTLLTGQEVALPTAALARIELRIESWAELRQDTLGQLRSLWKVKELEH